MKNFLFGIALSILLLLGQTGIQTQTALSIQADIQAKNLMVVYPKKTDKINADKTFIVGSTKPKSTLYINGIKTKVHPLGSFVKVVPLKEGNNIFTLESTLKGTKKVLKYKIFRTPKCKELKSKPLKIMSCSIAPDENLLYKQGDVIKVRFQGSTGHYAYFKLGNQSIPMRELSKTESGLRGVYEGFYQIKKSDSFKDAHIEVVLKSKKTFIKKIASGKISTMSKKKLLLGRCINDNTTTRDKPNGERLSPLPKNTIVSINGAQGRFYRIRLTKEKNMWIKKRNIVIISEGITQPENDLSKIDIYSDKKNTYLALPMDLKLPIEIKQTTKNKLRLDIYGSKFNFENVDYKDNEDISRLKIFQPDKNKLSMIIEPNSNQIWGYDYYYKNDELIIQIGKKPKIDINNPLKNIVIAIDPGHGGKEKGAIGPTNIPEKSINLDISYLLKKELESAGAKVIMTRKKDLTTKIYSRPKMAKQHHADLLISIHNNALPDGQDPYEKHGASNFYYHKQAQPLALSIQKELVSQLRLKDLGVFKRSFALTRPTLPISVLVECAYMIHPEEYEMLVRPYFQKKIAKAIKDGVEKFLKEEQ